ncbi:MAG: DUF1330 domain-containing protein [Halioglobus sp.]
MGSALPSVAGSLGAVRPIETKLKTWILRKNMSNPVFLIAQIDVKDYETYLTQYGFPLLHQLTEIGAEVLAADSSFKLLEGAWSGNWIAIIKFPSEKVMSEFYTSEKYAPLKTLRIEQLSNEGTVVVVPGIGNGQYQRS